MPRGPRSRWLSFVAIAFASPVEAVASEPAASALRSVRLSLETSDDTGACVSEASLRAAVTDRLGRDPFRGDAPDQLRVVVARDHELHARVERLDDGHTLRGARELAATSCAELVDTLSLSLAIAIDPYYVPAAPLVVEDDAVAVRAESPAPTPRPLSAWVAAGVVGAYGAEPSASLGASLQIGLQRGALRFGVAGRFDRAATRMVGTVEIRAASSFATAFGCVAWQRPRLCAQAGIAHVRGEARGIAMPRSDSTVVSIVGGRFAYAQPLGFARLVPHIDLDIASRRTSFEVDAMPVWRASRVQAAIGLALERDFL